jgi:hypothetical protein
MAQFYLILRDEHYSTYVNKYTLNTVLRTPYIYCVLSNLASTKVTSSSRNILTRFVQKSPSFGHSYSTRNILIRFVHIIQKPLVWEILEWTSLNPLRRPRGFRQCRAPYMVFINITLSISFHLNLSNWAKNWKCSNITQHQKHQQHQNINCKYQLYGSCDQKVKILNTALPKADYSPFTGMF